MPLPDIRAQSTPHDQASSFPLTCAAFLFAAALAALVTARIALIQVRPGHWDEYLFLSRVFEYQRGELYVALQTVHVRLFGWLAESRSTEWESLVAGRLAAELSLGVAVVLLGALARKAGGYFAAAAAMIAFLSLPSVVRHGGSFRADPFLLGLILMSAMPLASEVSIRNAIRSGLLLGAAFALSIKAALFLPVLILWCRVRRGPVIALGVSALISGAGLIVLHRTFDVTAGGQLAKRSVSTLFSGFVFASSPDGVGAALVQSVIDAPIHWFLVLLGLLLLCPRRGRPKLPLYQCEWWDGYRLAGVTAPLFVTLLYRNAFDYFMPLVFLFPALAAGMGAELLRRRFGTVPSAVLVAACLTAGPFRVSAAERMIQGRQEQMLSLLHRLFPDPVPYFDCCSMVSSFPKVGPFMSSWELSRMRREGKADLIADASPPPRFVLLNHPALESFGRPDGSVPREPSREVLSPADSAYLTNNFVPAGPLLLLPGYAATLAEGEERTFSLLIGGRYHLHAGGHCKIDGITPLQPYLELAEGEHRAVGIEGGGRCELRLQPPGELNGSDSALAAPPLDRGPILR